MGLSRSEQMRRIRGKDTGPEVTLRRRLWARGLRYRLGMRVEGCRPDLVFPAARLVVFLDGCFWHGCPAHYSRPNANGETWARKLRENVDRDRRQTLRLEEARWRVLRLWEHEVREDVGDAVEHVERALAGDDSGDGPSWRVVRVDVVDPGARIERREDEDLRDASIRRSGTGRRVVATKPGRNLSAPRATTQRPERSNP